MTNVGGVFSLVSPTLTDVLVSIGAPPVISLSKSLTSDTRFSISIQNKISTGTWPVLCGVSIRLVPLTTEGIQGIESRG